MSPIIVLLSTISPLWLVGVGCSTAGYGQCLGKSSQVEKMAPAQRATAVRDSSVPRGHGEVL